MTIFRALNLTSSAARRAAVPEDGLFDRENSGERYCAAIALKSTRWSAGKVAPFAFDDEYQNYSDKHGQKADLREPQRLAGSIFPGKRVTEKTSYRTIGANAVRGVTAALGRDPGDS